MANNNNPGCGCSGLVLFLLFLMVASGSLNPLVALIIFAFVYMLLS